MQYFMRKELDVDAPVNLRRLSPKMKIYAGLVSKWHESKFYKSQYNKRMDAMHAEQVRRDEKLKEALLVIIYRELNNNKSLKAKGEECSEIIVCVKSKFIHSLDRIIEHKEFLPYVLKKIDEEPDVRTAFPEMPILLCVKKKVLDNE